MWYQLGQIIYANNLIYGECLFSPGDLESDWVADVSHAGTTRLHN